MRYGDSWTDAFTSLAEYNAFVYVHCDSSFPAFAPFRFESVHVAEVNAFSTELTFFIVYLWIPKYFCSGDPFVCVFSHSNYLYIF